MKKKSGKLPNNKKSFGITFVTYGMVFIEKLLKLYDGMPSMVEAVCKGKLDLLVLSC